MLTVAILINGEPLVARSIVNKLEKTGYYWTDAGVKIKHNPKDGAIALAIKALKTIKKTNL